MKIFESTGPLVIEIPDGGRRLIAELFNLEDYQPGKAGLIFFDTGWNEASLNPIHIIEGKIDGEGPWDVAGADAEIAPLEIGDPLTDQWDVWTRYRAEDPDGRMATRERAREILKSGSY